ncbi:MAG TPA: hypothetical protein VEI01_12445 [Terriglobales bacterium]|nr:hypothetical protein [Terriglobales bacterium]
MKYSWLGMVGILLPLLRVAQTAPGQDTQTGRGPYARIAILRPHNGDTVDFEAGYMRHRDWHRQAKDNWAWFGWTIWTGERQRWFVYATFAHSAASLDSPVARGEDERDTIWNLTPHVPYLGNALCPYLPGLSRGTGEPSATAKLEFTTVELAPGAEKAFEAAVSSAQARLEGETLWYRMLAGGTAPRYVRLRPRPRVSSILDASSEQALPDAVDHLIVKMTVEILNLRPAMCYGLSPVRQ